MRVYIFKVGSFIPVLKTQDEMISLQRNNPVAELANHQLK